MPFKIVPYTGFYKDVQKVIQHNKELKVAFMLALDEITTDPTQGKMLKGNLAGLYNMRVEGKDYRLIYRAYACCALGADCKYPGGDDENPEMECQGVVQLLYFLSRQDCDNLYRLKKKYFKASVLDLNLLDD